MNLDTTNDRLMNPGTRTFTAVRHVTDDGMWADSRQLPGFVAVADTPDELFRLVREAPAVYLGWPEGTYNVLLLN